MRPEFCQCEDQLACGQFVKRVKFSICLFKPTKPACVLPRRSVLEGGLFGAPQKSLHSCCRKLRLGVWCLVRL